YSAGRRRDEAVLDRGASFVKHICDEEEVEGHHTVYIGVHVPKSYHRRRRHRRKSNHKEKRERVEQIVGAYKSDAENADDSCTSILKPLRKNVRILESMRGIQMGLDDLCDEITDKLKGIRKAETKDKTWFTYRLELKNWQKTPTPYSMLCFLSFDPDDTLCCSTALHIHPYILSLQFVPQLKNKFMKKLPRDAEASNVLVGEVDFLETPFVAFVRLQQAVMLGALTEVPVPTRFMFVLLGPKGKSKSYREIGRAIATLMSDEVFHDIAYKAKGRKDLLAGIDEFLDEVIVLPPGEWDPDIRIEPPKSLPSSDKRKNMYAGGEAPQINGDTLHDTGHGGGGGGGHQVGEELQFTRKFCGGLILDVKRKLPFFASDFYDALHIQSLSAILFIYLGTVTNAITFGGLLGDATENMQGVLESFLGTALTGVVFCLLAGQPLTILSSTGPVLVFERLLFTFSKDNSFDYLEFRLWIGLWSGLFCLVLVATDASFLVQYFTRFTEEGFSALISFIFIYDAFKKMIKLAHHNPINSEFDHNLITQYDCRCVPGAYPSSLTVQTSRPDRFFKHVLTQLIVYSWPLQPENATWASLTQHQCKEFGGLLVGEACDYVPDITLMSFILFFGTYTCSMALKKFKTSRFFPTTVRKLISDFAIILTILLFCGIDALVGVDTPKLIVPSEFKPTNPARGWFIPPFGGNPWWVYLAAALPALLVTILIFMDQQITAVIVNRKEHKLKKGAGYHLDLFWVAVLIILCSFMGLPWYVAATVISIAHIDSLKMETQTSAPGEQPKFLGVREQRVTGIFVFLLTGLSVFMAPILKFIPMPVLYGVFLYMGVASLNGVQFMDRLLLLLMPAKHQPDLIYLRHVPQRRIHLFTFIQVLCLALLWILKSTVAAIIFPVMILALVAVRKAMDYLFSQHDLSYLDDVIPEKDKKKKEDEKKKKNKKKGSIDSEIDYSDYPYHENIPSIKISMEMMEQEPMLGNKSLDIVILNKYSSQHCIPIFI
uniref:Anion exchange protein n=1 Tax=Xiphophorus couchianus TaxID=32473 RepID=A0A3B5MW86_9TELE